MLKQTDDGIVANIKISPNAKKNEIIREGEFVKIKITAQPIDGKANKALVEFLSKYFKIPKTSRSFLMVWISPKYGFDTAVSQRVSFVTSVDRSILSNASMLVIPLPPFWNIV